MHSRTVIFPGGKKKVVTLSYDDGNVYDEKLCEIMSKYGVKGTFNINSGISNGRRMDPATAIALYDKYGMEVANHGEDHRYCATVSTSMMMIDVLNDRINLEKATGRLVKGMAYAYGSYSKDVKEILRLAGIDYCRTTKATYDFKFPTDWLELDPTCHHTDARLNELTDKFIDLDMEKPYGRASVMFYLWGHSYEFNDGNNWEIIEEFCKKVSGHKDEIWFATNGEVFEYMKAYDSLQFSADESFVYNPSLIEVSFRDFWGRDKSVITVKPGETLFLK